MRHRQRLVLTLSNRRRRARATPAGSISCGQAAAVTPPTLPLTAPAPPAPSGGRDVGLDEASSVSLRGLRSFPSLQSCSKSPSVKSTALGGRGGERGSIEIQATGVTIGPRASTGGLAARVCAFVAPVIRMFIRLPTKSGNPGMVKADAGKNHAPLERDSTSTSIVSPACSHSTCAHNARAGLAKDLERFVDKLPHLLSHLCSRSLLETHPYALVQLFLMRSDSS